MTRCAILCILVFLFNYLPAQQKIKKTVKDTVGIKANSIAIEDIKQNIRDNLPVVSLDDADMNNAGSQNASSVLTAGRDPFFSAASYNFSVVRFKIRGYDADNFTAYMNGAPMENLDNGFTLYGLWGGLNEVMRNRDLSIALRANTFSFGEPGSTTNIDSRASKQRKQTEFGYALANRNYTHRWSVTHSTGLTKKGWAFTFSGSRRWANEGYVPGTYYDGWSYFAGVDKRLGQKQLLSLVAFGAPAENGKQSAATAEAIDLAGTHYYNPGWGYQSGKKRNANVARINQPVFILTHDLRINNKSTLISAVSYSFGDKGSSSLDWYNAQDPRPDYYRNLPGYYKADPNTAAQVEQQWRNNESTRQINWNNIYDANRASNETFNGTTGRRCRYILDEAVNNSQRFNFNTVYNSTLSSNIEFTAGASYQSQKNNYYKKILDLLGGDYFVDLNQFAERSYPNNTNANQNDLNRPNRIVHTGNRYGYDYNININKTAAWIQTVFKFKKVDFFLAGELSNTQFFRTGNVKNGLFPNNSYGKSSVHRFTDFSFKAGLTYKINGRNYLYVHEGIMSKAPFFENVYLSSRTRDMTQNNVTSEQHQIVEAGYVLNAPRIKLRLSGYYATFNNQLNVMSFYHDAYQNLVNYAISNINKVHYGMEFGFDAKVLPNITLAGAVAVSRYYYNSRQLATVTLDNDASVLESDSVYVNDYRVGGTPQEAYSLSITYRSPKYWFISLNGNYFDQMWLDINPVRRTYKAVQDLAYGSAERNAILAQEQFKPQSTVDLFAGYSWKLPRSWSINKKPTFLVFSAGISNLLNNQNIVSGGYEQLRFDFATHDVNKFPSKYYYAYGLNYFISTVLRF